MTSSSSSYCVFDKKLAERTLERVSASFVVDEDIAKGLLEKAPFVVDKNDLKERVFKHLDNLKNLVIEREFSDPPTAEDVEFSKTVSKILEFMNQLYETFVYGPPLTQDSAALQGPIVRCSEVKLKAGEEGANG